MQRSTFKRLIAGTFTLAALLAFASPQGAQAATSGNATIFNEVTVSYGSGSASFTDKADFTVTVNTVATAPTVYVDTTLQTTTAGTTVNYVYTVRSNSNGFDTYTITTPVTSANGSISDPTNNLNFTSRDLWAGIVLSSGAGTINLPGGTTFGLSDNDTVELMVGGAVHRYTVTITTPGNGASSGVGETETILTLTPIGTATPITALNVTAGAQVGEYQTVTLAQTAGVPTTSGTDGTHVTNLTLTTTATDGLGAVVVYTTTDVAFNEVTTIVSAPNLTISKGADKNSAKPGETIIYTITIENLHATAAASNVSVTDPVPTYTTYVPGTTTLDGNPVADVGSDSALQAGLTVGNLAAGATATIVYQVTID